MEAGGVQATSTRPCPYVERCHVLNVIARVWRRFQGVVLFSGTERPHPFREQDVARESSRFQIRYCRLRNGRSDRQKQKTCLAKLPRPAVPALFFLFFRGLNRMIASAYLTTFFFSFRACFLVI